MTPEMMSAILGTGGILGALVVIVPKVIDGWQANRSGRAQREREHNRSIIEAARRAEAARDHAEEERDEAREQRDRAEVDLHDMATKARKISEYASRLRRQMYEAGLEPEGWPDDL